MEHMGEVNMDEAKNATIFGYFRCIYLTWPMAKL